jgi:hypothetical protein
MNRQKLIKEVLDEYVGSQINIDSESARIQLANHIESVLSMNEFKTSSFLKADAIRQSNPEQEKKLKELVDKSSKTIKHIDGCGYDD